MIPVWIALVLLAAMLVDAAESPFRGSGRRVGFIDWRVASSVAGAVPGLQGGEVRA